MFYNIATLCLLFHLRMFVRLKKRSGSMAVYGTSEKSKVPFVRCGNKDISIKIEASAGGNKVP